MLSVLHVDLYRAVFGVATAIVRIIPHEKFEILQAYISVEIGNPLAQCGF